MALFDDVFAPYVRFGGRLLHLTTPRQRGTDVAVLQAIYNLMLATMNPPLGPLGSLIAITGVYDAATAGAVRNVQSYFGLSVDGVVGQDTYFAFGQGVLTHVTYGGPAYGSRQLQAGDSGGDVTVLQNRLNIFRYSALIGRPANGFFSAGTAAAVGGLKADATTHGDRGFPPNAIAGFGFYDASWLYTIAGGRGIFTGRNGFDVAMVQLLLRTLGFYSGRITGYYDGPTQAAVQALQAASGISVDGVVGQQTYFAIGQRNSNPAPTPAGLAWPISVTLTSSSGPVSGQTVLYFIGSQLVVDVSAAGLTPGTTYEAYIFFGTCASGGQVAFPLVTLVAGPSGTAEATVEIPGILVVPTAGWFVAIALPPSIPGAQPTIVSCGDVAPPFPVLSPVAVPSNSPVTVSVLPVDGFTASGSGVLSFTAPQTLQATVTISGLVPGSRHPNHIHYGTCQGVPGGPIAYSLTDLVAKAQGVATATTIISGVTAIPPVGWYVNVHLGPTLEDGGATPIACGNVSPPQPVLPVVGI